MVTTDGLPSDLFDPSIKDVGHLQPDNGMKCDSVDIKCEHPDTSFELNLEISLSEWKQLQKHANHHITFVSRFLLNLPTEFDKFEKQRSTLAFITIGFYREIDKFTTFDYWTFEDILCYLRTRRQLASSGIQLLMCMSPTDNVSDPDILCKAVARIADLTNHTQASISPFLTGSVASKERATVEYDFKLMQTEEESLKKIITGKVRLYPTSFISLIRIPQTCDQIGVQMMRSNVIEIAKEYLYETGGDPFFLTQYRINSLLQSNRGVTSMLLILLPFIVRTFQLSKMELHSRQVASWKNSQLSTYFRTQSFLQILFHTRQVPSLCSILESVGLDVFSFFRRIRLSEGLHSLSDAGHHFGLDFLPSLSGQKKISCKLVQPFVHELVQRQLAQKRRNLPGSQYFVDQFLNMFHRPEIVCLALEVLLKREDNIFSRTFDNERISGDVDRIIYFLMKKWKNKKMGVKIAMCYRRFSRQADISIVIDLYLLCRMKKGCSTQISRHVEKMLGCLHSWRMNSFNCSKDKMKILKGAKIISPMGYSWKKSVSTVNPMTTGLLLESFEDARGFPRPLLLLLRNGEREKFTSGLIDFALAKCASRDAFIRRLTGLTKTTFKDETVPIGQSFLYQHVHSDLSSRTHSATSNPRVHDAPLLV